MNTKTLFLCNNHHRFFSSFNSFVWCCRFIFGGAKVMRMCCYCCFFTWNHYVYAHCANIKQNSFTKFWEKMTKFLFVFERFFFEFSSKKLLWSVRTRDYIYNFDAMHFTSSQEEEEGGPKKHTSHENNKQNQQYSARNGNEMRKTLVMIYR